MDKKIIIYQIFTRLFGNRNVPRKVNGSVAENGVGKMNDFTPTVLRHIHDMGVTHVWYTGVIRHASQTDYSSFGIPKQSPAVVKGVAGSPYAIADYYDIDPDLAENVNCRMEEFEELVDRTHKAGMKVIIDFVPNHVAREYKSVKKPTGVKDLGQDDDKTMNFSQQNNFYYTGMPIDLSGVTAARNQDPEKPYVETPAKATGNDRFDNRPGDNDWYETVKLNYGIDYCNGRGRSYHFDPIPNTWAKMTDILLFWASKGVDGFRCDMAEMVPASFWSYATGIVKNRYPKIDFIGEVYDGNQYRTFISSGFDYLYDKVGMYDAVRAVIRGERPAASITYQWQTVGDIAGHMLYFLENHDEQRIASDFFCGDGNKAIPGVIVSALLMRNPFMFYAGQEFGERGMDAEGFSGRDGRTTIFDYWSLDSLIHGYYDRRHMPKEEKALALKYQQILRIANREKAIFEGDFFDLMYVNPASYQFNPRFNFAFLRKAGSDVILVVANFSGDRMNVKVNIPDHAFDYLGLPETTVVATDLLTGEEQTVELTRNGQFPADLRPYSGRIFKFTIMKDDTDYVFNEHNKDEFPPAHTAEHLLNQVMIRLFGCKRSTNAHVERKKSKISYVLDHKPTRQEEKAIEQMMNEMIQADMPVTFETVDIDNLPEGVDRSRLPKDASQKIRLVRIGDFDVCPCIGKHVRSTAQIGRFELLGTNWDEATHTFRVRFKVVQ